MRKKPRLTKNRYIPNSFKIHQSLPEKTQLSDPVESMVTQKKRFYPNKSQRTLLQKCFHAHNYFYNQCIEFINKNAKLEKGHADKKGINPISVRHNIKIRNAELEFPWMTEVPFDTRDEALRKAVISYKTGVNGVKTTMEIS